MAVEVKLGDRHSHVSLIETNGDKMKVKLDDKIYELDVKLVERGVYSVIIDNQSINLEMIQGQDSRHYSVNSLYHAYDIEIIDAQTKYMLNRGASDLDSGNSISSPMPGKVVKIPVKTGDSLKAGETAIVVEAMKMQSEYKVSKDCIVKKININEGDKINGDQVLVELE
jgi:biotin carboxyl carrier protein